MSDPRTMGEVKSLRRLVVFWAITVVAIVGALIAYVVIPIP